MGLFCSAASVALNTVSLGFSAYYSSLKKCLSIAIVLFEDAADKRAMLLFCEQGGVIAG